MLGNKIMLLFQLCLEEWYYPAVFKTALLFALSKPRKWQKHQTQFYIFIALLSYLKKVLKLIVAWRLENIILKSRLVSPL